jgi:hypothetical protein
MDLFDHALKEWLTTETPLAARMQPRNFDKFMVTVNELD